MLVFCYQLSLGQGLNAFLMRYGLTPLRFILAGHLAGVSVIERCYPLFTSLFLHGDWFHILILGNMLYLWIFGRSVEDRSGHGGFALFYLVCGLFAALTQVYLNPSARMPMVGPSGAVAGVLGAYLVLFPHAHIVALVPLMFFWQVVEVPAMLFLLVWFLMQFFNRATSLTTHTIVAGVTWWAHIGGFVSGVALGFLVLKRKRLFWAD